MTRSARRFGTVFRTEPRHGMPADRSDGDADWRRTKADLDAIRARFPDHA